MPSRLKVLAIDDEKKILRLVRDILEVRYDVVIANNGKEGIELAQTERPDLILVDKIMPEMDGIETTQFIRTCVATQNIPIIMLTALKEPADRAKAFHAGVDDFISKPFHPDELLARIEAKMTRFESLQQKTLSQELGYLNLRIDLDEGAAYINDKVVHLTRLEFKILHTLVAHRGKVRSRMQLLTDVWGNAAAEPRALDAHITSLRKKIKRFNGVIAAIYGRGYIIREG